jgi:hypothetical protein
MYNLYMYRNPAPGILLEAVHKEYTYILKLLISKSGSRRLDGDMKNIHVSYSGSRHIARGCTKVYTTNINTEPEFLNVYGAQESIPKNRFRQPM